MCDPEMNQWPVQLNEAWRHKFEWFQRCSKHANPISTNVITWLFCDQLLIVFFLFITCFTGHGLLDTFDSHYLQCSEATYWCSASNSLPAQCVDSCGDMF